MTIKELKIVPPTMGCMFFLLKIQEEKVAMDFEDIARLMR
jgi:hypothetical protein